MFLISLEIAYVKCDLFGGASSEEVVHVDATGTPGAAVGTVAGVGATAATLGQAGHARAFGAEPEAFLADKSRAALSRGAVSILWNTCGISLHTRKEDKQSSVNNIRIHFIGTSSLAAWIGQQSTHDDVASTS